MALMPLYGFIWVISHIEAYKGIQMPLYGFILNKRAEGLIKLFNSLIKLSKSLMKLANSLIKLSARNQEPRFPEKFC